MTGRTIRALHRAPHLHQGDSTERMMWTAVLCLLPAGIWGIWSFGLKGLAVVGTSVAAAVVGELIANLLTRRLTIHDGSAVLSGLLIGYMLPSNAPLSVPIAASLFAMIVIKATFGGLGSNWLNPAVGGQVFAYFSWPGKLSAWGTPRLWPGGAAAHSPLQFLSSGGGNQVAAGGTVLSGYPVTPFGSSVAHWLSTALGYQVDPHYVDLIVGTVPGGIGAVSVLLLLLGSIYLFVRRAITWQAPAGFVASFVVLVWVFGGVPLHEGWFQGTPLIHLLTGATVLAVLYLSSDPVTSPLSPGGSLFFGAGVGLLAFLIRTFGAAEEAVYLAILLMNLTVPAIDQVAEWRLRNAR